MSSTDLSSFQRLGARLFGIDTSTKAVDVDSDDLELKRIGTQAPLAESWWDGHPIIKPFEALRALESLKDNPFLYSALKKKIEAIASVPFFVEEFVQGSWRRVENHPAEHLIEGANPYMSGFELKMQLAMHKELSGSSYAQIVLSSGRPVFLQPLFPQYMTPVPSVTDFLESFEYRIDSAAKDGRSKHYHKRFKPAEVLWSKYPNPTTPYEGLSPLQAIRNEILVDQDAVRWNRVSLQHRGATDVAFVLKDVKSEKDYRLARSMILDRYMGAENARMPWIIGGNSDVRPMSYNAVEMDFLDTRKFNRQIISNALGVPTPLIGDSDNSTYNNLSTLEQVFWSDTIVVWLEAFRQDMTRQILRRYYENRSDFQSPGKLRYMCDFTNVEALQTAMRDKVAIAEGMRRVGYTLAQVNDKLEIGVPLDAGQSEALKDSEVEKRRGPVPSGSGENQDPDRNQERSLSIRTAVEERLAGMAPDEDLEPFVVALNRAYADRPDEGKARERYRDVYAPKLAAGDRSGLVALIASLETANA